MVMLYGPDQLVCPLVAETQAVLLEADSLEVFCVTGSLHNRTLLVGPRAEETGGQSSVCSRRRGRRLTGLLSSLDTDLDVTRPYTRTRTHLHMHMIIHNTHAYTPQQYSLRRRAWQRRITIVFGCLQLNCPGKNPRNFCFL